MATSWTDLIADIESVKPSDEIIKAAVQFLTDDAKLKDPASATGVTEADLEKVKPPDLLPAAALVRRLVRSVEAVRPWTRPGWHRQPPSQPWQPHQCLQKL